MRSFTNIIRHSLLRLATTLAALLVGMTFALTTSVASAAVVIDINKIVFDINKVVIVKPHPVVNVMQPASKVEVPPVVKPEVKVDSSLGVVRPLGIRPFLARPFFARPSDFNPFFDEEFFGFEE